MNDYTRYLLDNVDKEYLKSIYNKMKDRVYNNSNLKEYSYYKDVNIGWKTFEEFSDWFYFKQDSFLASKKNITRYKYQLDKDLFAERNYNDRCVFVPKYINTMIQTQPGLRRDLPLGVSKGRNGKYSVYISILGKSSHVCIKRTVTDITEAFYIYKLAKEFYIKIIGCEFYKRKLITTKVYNKLEKYIISDDSKFKIQVDNVKINQLKDKLSNESLFFKILKLIQRYSIPEINKTLDNTILFN